MKTVETHRDPSWTRRLKGLASAIAASALLAGCVGAASSPSPTAPTVGMTAAASESPLLTANPAETASPATTATAIPATTASPTPGATAALASHPSTGVAPAAKWTALKWTSAGTAFPQTPTAPNQDSDVEVSVFGWSRGYVGFRAVIDMSSDVAGAVVVSTSSTDGLHWTAGRSLDITGLANFGRVGQMVEGPGGLLAVGRPQPMACGGPSTVDGLWTSTDGVAWTRVMLSGDLASAVLYTVDAGSTGYIATGALTGGAPALWISQDGRSWHRLNLSTSTFGGAVVDGATDFAAGFVISGAVRGDGTCGGYQTLTPSLWWSKDGTSWTRARLAGIAPASDAWVTVARINDHCLMAVANEWNASSQVTNQRMWVTSDGQTWTVVSAPSPLLGWGVMSSWQRGIVVASPADNQGPSTIVTVGDDLAVTPVAQTGAVPTASDDPSGWIWALGPNGMVSLSYDGVELRVGAATA